MPRKPSCFQKSHYECNLYSLSFAYERRVSLNYLVLHDRNYMSSEMCVLYYFLMLKITFLTEVVYNFHLHICMCNDGQLKWQQERCSADYKPHMRQYAIAERSGILLSVCCLNYIYIYVCVYIYIYIYIYAAEYFFVYTQQTNTPHWSWKIGSVNITKMLSAFTFDSIVAFNSYHGVDCEIHTTLSGAYINYIAKHSLSGTEGPKWAYTKHDPPLCP